MQDTRFDQRELLDDVTERASRFLAALPERRVGADPAAIAALEAWSTSKLSDRGISPREVVAELDARLSAATVASAGPRFFGFVHGGSLPAALAANWLAGAWDQNAFSRASSPAAVWIEAMAAAWLLDVLGLPEDSAVAFTTGATLANFTALAAARRRVLADVGCDVEADGLFGAPPITVCVGAECHPTLRKGLGLLGLGRRRVVELEVDRQGRIRADRLPDLHGPLIVCAQAGNVNSGACDPFEALHAWCSERGAWLHVDGAFGLWAQASPALRPLTTGVWLADSWATDGHKWLNVPYDCGIAVVRDAEALHGAMSFGAPYLPTEPHREPFHYGPEASRRARGIEVYAALRSLGRRGVAEMIEAGCRHARRFAEGLREAGHSVLNDVVLNQVVVSFGTAEVDRAVIAAIQAAGECWCGPTHWQGRDAMRISVSGWATSDQDVERSLASILDCAAAVLARRDPVSRLGETTGRATATD
jgi:glutamate/tyrosine decarboxylase-like PLP-dependent enzyme